MEITEKVKIFRNVWCCAYQRRWIYNGTEREHREHETVRMCLDMKNTKFYEFDSEKTNYLK